MPIKLPDCTELIKREGFDNDILLIRRPWSMELSQFINDNEIDGVAMGYTSGWEGLDLNFLSQVKRLRYFMLIDRYIEDVTGVSQLINLEYLKLATFSETPIDFSKFVKLKICSFDWIKGCDSLFDCRTIEDLFLIGYPGANFKKISKISELRKIRMFETRLKTLEGIENLEKLKHIEIVTRGLESLKPLTELNSIEVILIYENRKITDIDGFENLINLKKLHLDCKEIESLQPLKSCKNLEKLVFDGVSKDGNLAFLNDLPKLKNLQFQYRNHYTHSVDDILGNK